MFAICFTKKMDTNSTFLHLLSTILPTRSVNVNIRKGTNNIGNTSETV